MFVGHSRKMLIEAYASPDSNLIYNRYFSTTNFYIPFELYNWYYIDTCIDWIYTQKNKKLIKIRIFLFFFFLKLLNFNLFAKLSIKNISLLTFSKRKHFSLFLTFPFPPSLRKHKFKESSPPPMVFVVNTFFTFKKRENLSCP